MMSEEELHSMRVIGEMLGTTASFLPLSTCILYVYMFPPLRFDAFGHVH